MALVQQARRGSPRDRPWRRGKALDQPAALLHLCHKHHTLVHNRPSVVRDLAVKQAANDGTYDLAKVNELRGRVIEQSEVDRWML